ncbi:hypothetical protein C8R43DRAFT_1046445 [Mycena crocata]|nr:hypothetical protein C8R43DRAFT_1046445 [Mycena crocata]
MLSFSSCSSMDLKFPPASAHSLSLIRLVSHYLIEVYDFTSAPVSMVTSSSPGPNAAHSAVYRRVLHAFTDFSPKLLEPVLPGYSHIPYAYRFIAYLISEHQNFFQVYLELHAFLTTALAATKISTPTPVLPLQPNSTSRNTRLTAEVQSRDAEICRLTGYMSFKHSRDERTALARSLPHQINAFQRDQQYILGDLQVVNAIPWNPGHSFIEMLRRLVGFRIPPPDTTQNMVLLLRDIHVDFGDFRLYFDDQWRLIFRSSERAFPRLCARTLVPTPPLYSDRRLSDLAGRDNIIGSGQIYLNRTVYGNSPVPLPSLFWFQLHRLIGDVFFASGLAENIQDEWDRAEETGAHILNDENAIILHLGLQALEEVWQERERVITNAP